MKAPNSHNLSIALPLGFAAALGACGESPCLDAKDYDFSRNPENTQAFYDEAVSVDSCYHPARNATVPPLENAQVPLHFNVLYSDGVKIEDIRSGIQRDLAALNYAFESLNVTFSPAGTTEIKKEVIKKEGVNQYAKIFPKTAGFPVYYFPKTNESDGFAGHSAPFIYYANPNYEDPWRRKDGYASTVNGLAHEMGHMLGLQHPFSEDGKGDGLSDTLDYYAVCGVAMNDWSPYPVETSVENGTCYVGCADSCGHKAPANVMDNFHCAPDVPLIFSPQQKQILNCALQDNENVLAQYLVL